MTLHKEVHLETEICTDLQNAGWLHDAGDSARYDRPRALFVDDTVAWVQTSQPKVWQTLAASHGDAAPAKLAERLRQTLNGKGTLEVLRRGFDMIGLKHSVAMCEFMPAHGFNADLQARYAANRLRVVRQVRYSVHHENSIDLVLFVNGIPVATAELKSDYTQSVDDAVDQYRHDRLPAFKPKNAPEPLLAFPGGALVHFAVSNTAARMATRLAGADTVFLPFDRGDGGGAGNPPNPAGIATDYLWKEIWERDSFLQILGRYLVPQKNAAKQHVGWIFPRYHQLDATRRLVAAVANEGPGRKYLVQHSAGSGKTNSIAWTAHRLADLHRTGADGQERKVFDTVLVISDRTVLDDQLQEAILAFERTTGVVAVVTGQSASKTEQLAAALAGNKKIVVCTVQTFPFALDKVRELAATQHKRFAVIVDEAHSSQTSKTAAELKVLLGADADPGSTSESGEPDNDAIIAAQTAAKAGADEKAGITYVAFTATPKARTLQLFGTRPNPNAPASDDNLPAPFHVYSMRQAIEEGFILDVLKTYLPYKVVFALANGDATLDAKKVDKAEATRRIIGWLRLNEHNIAQRVEMVVEHYRRYVAGLLGGKAKAMVVTASREEAVRWQLAARKYIDERGYAIGSLVAFSGEVNHPEKDSEGYTEHSALLNPKLGSQDIRNAFKGDDYRLLLVANKFQTGFDEPLLCAMYVDKKLGGIQAVQTLSRLNRCYPGKDQTYVVDFVNDPADILAAFEPYYETAELSGVTDPNVVYGLRDKLDGQMFYDDDEIERVVAVALKGGSAKPSELDAVLAPVAGRLLKRYAAAKQKLDASGDDAAKAQAARAEMDTLVLFKGDLSAYLCLYAFLSQIVDYGNTAMEKRSIFYRLLHPLLNFGRQRAEVDVSALQLVSYAIKAGGPTALKLAVGEPEKIYGASESGSGQVQEKPTAAFAELLAQVNDLFGGETTTGDALVYVNEVIKGSLLASKPLAEQAVNNGQAHFEQSPDLDKGIDAAAMDALATHPGLSKQVLQSAELRRGIKKFVLGPGQLYQGLRAAASAVQAGR